MTDLSVLDMLARLLAAGLLSAVVGYEREAHHKPAGMRTNALVGMGTALAVVAFAGSALAPSIMTGIGFVGGGVIIHSGGSVRGLTTAASIWMVAAIAIACGLGMFDLAVIGTILAMLALVGMPKLSGKSESTE